MNEEDILAEWRNAGLLKQGGCGVAFEVPIRSNFKGRKNNIIWPPPRRRRAYRLTKLTNGDEVKKKLEEKQRKASERRKVRLMHIG